MAGRHRTLSLVRRRTVRAVVAVSMTLLSAGVIATLAGPSRADVAESSAVTVSGTGAFSSLKITVGQTKGLIDQVVPVSWTGATPTVPSSGSFDRNYLQIMQCWGDDPAGPQREQCQYGGLTGDTRGGVWVAGRQVTYTNDLVDPLETYKVPAGSLSTIDVPFHSVTGKVITTSVNEFYDASSTNEITLARTRPDGTGQEFFEMQTAREAPGLGCGEALSANDGGVRGRGCWLVVVPRSDKEVNGKVRSGGFHLDSSPLSATNWANRIVVPLDFQPIGRSCTLGKAERPTVGQETIAEAIGRWQPKLCEMGSAIYGYSQVGDATARRQLKTDKPGLAFISRPLPADAQNPKGPAVYAPVAIDGLAIAFDIERQSTGGAPESVKERNGERMTSLKLTPRLVAKLLTQSYRSAVDYDAPDVSKNPLGITTDPEFLALNPEFKELFFTGTADVLLPIGLADTTSQVWTWLYSDPEASAFLNGAKDPYGMTVNPNYKRLESPRDDFPKRDPFCKIYGDFRGPYCTFDAHPYAADLHDAARSASRGDTLARYIWDATAAPPQWKHGPAQLSGSRAVLAFTDTATAARYSLPTAQIRNAAGVFVTPSPASLLAAVAQMSPSSTPGVLVPNPATTSKDAYPLATISYATTIPLALDVSARSDYSAFIKYAVGAGQISGNGVGQLPQGYAPLSEALRKAALKAAQAIVDAKAAPSTDATLGPVRPQPSSNGTAPTTPAASAGRASAEAGPSAPEAPVQSSTTLLPGGLDTPRVARKASVESIRPISVSGLARYGTLLIVVVGLTGLLAGPGLHVAQSRRSDGPKQ